MKSKCFILITTIFIISCSSSNIIRYENGATASLKPNLSTDEREIWRIYSSGNGYTSYERVKLNALVRAAVTSHDEGSDCFIVLDSEGDVRNYNYTYTTKETYSAKSNYSENYNNSSDYYGSRGGYLGSSNTHSNMYGTSTTSYEVPVTHTKSYDKYSYEMYVEFLNNKQCYKLKTSKWRDNIHYNNAVMKFYEDLREKEKNYDRLEAVGWIGLGVASVVAIIMISNMDSNE